MSAKPRRGAAAPPVPTNADALARYTQEHAALAAQMDSLTHRLRALDGVVAGLNQLLGNTAPPPPRRRGTEATGTKALILDVLADGQRRKLAELADAVNVPRTAVAKHITHLVADGDVDRQGQSRATTYGIPRTR